MGWLPFDEIIRGNIVESLYAADLWSVYTSRAPERYQNPDQFFQRTYFTSSLRNFLSDLARRLSGDPNVNPVVLILTGLGGGKTHSLIAAYHISKNANYLSASVIEKLEKEGISIPRGVNPIVIVFDGAQLDPQYLSKNYGTRTLWGYIFKKLYEETNDEKIKEALNSYQNSDTVPGAEVLYELLSRLESNGRPVVILIDETLNFLTNLNPNEREKTELFLHHLTKAIVQLKRSYIALTFSDTQEGRNIADKLRGIIERVSKNESMITPHELPAVIRQALLRDVRDAEEEAKKLYEKYSSYSTTFSETYTLETLIDYYPLHPVTIKLLSKLTTTGLIQATRDVLRILAWTLHDLYRSGRSGVFITLGDIPIENNNIKNTVIKDDYLRNAVNQDISDIDMLENKLGKDSDCGKLVRRIYRATVLATLAYGYLSEKDIATYVYSPDLSISPLVIPECIKDRMLGFITHLHSFSKNGISYYAVKSKTYWKAILRRRLDEIKEEDLEKFREEIKRRLRKAKQIYEKTYIWEYPPDEPGLAIVLADPAWDDPREVIEKRKDGKPRIYRGSVIVLNPDKGVYKNALRLAAEHEITKDIIINNYKEYGLDENDINDVKDHETKVNSELNNIVLGKFYVGLIYAKGEGELIEVPEGIDLFKDPGQIFKRIRDVLLNDGKLAEKISVEKLQSFIENYYKNMDKLPTFRELIEVFGGKLPDEPVLINPRAGIESTIKDGMKKGIFIVVRGERAIQDIEYIGDDDLIATTSIRRPPQIEVPIEDKAIIKEQSIIPQKPPRPTTINLKEITPKELVNQLQQYNKVKLTIRDEIEEEPSKLEDVMSFLKMFIDRTKNIIKMKVNIYAEIPQTNNIAKFNIEIDNVNDDKIRIAIDTVEIVKSIITRFSNVAKVQLSYEVINRIDVKNVIKELNTPLFVEKYKNLKMNVTLEEIV
jgi:hypothetical protein